MPAGAFGLDKPHNLAYNGSILRIGRRVMQGGVMQEGVTQGGVMQGGFIKRERRGVGKGKSDVLEGNSGAGSGG